MLSKKRIAYLTDARLAERISGDKIIKRHAAEDLPQTVPAQDVNGALSGALILRAEITAGGALIMYMQCTDGDIRVYKAEAAPDPRHINVTSKSILGEEV